MPPGFTSSLPLSSAESLFAEVATLAALLFDVPLALLALVDAPTVDYFATHGVLAAAAQPRVAALCLQTTQQQHAVVLSDLPPEPAPKADAAGRPSPGGVRFYAGVPLLLPNQACWGALCLLDYQPRPFGVSAQQVLRQLAQVVGRLLAIRQHCLTSWAEDAAYWRIVQQTLHQEVRTLLALVRLRTEVGDGGPPAAVPLDFLEVVDQQLGALHWRLTDYHPTLL